MKDLSPKMGNWLIILFLSAAILLVIFLLFMAAEKCSKYFYRARGFQFREKEGTAERSFSWSRLAGSDDDSGEDEVDGPDNTNEVTLPRQLLLSRIY